MDVMLTYHVEGEASTPSAAVFHEIEQQVRLADRLGYSAAWFAEHHFHVHRGHLPNPLLFALHLAGKTERIHLGSAVICTGLHHPLRLAEDLITADVLTGGRLSIGLGSGSSPSEFTAFGVTPDEQTAAARHARFAEQLDVLEQAWRGEAVDVQGERLRVTAPPVLPRPLRPLKNVLWIAANSLGQATLTGQRGYALMLSRERTVEEMRDLVAAYDAGRRAAGHPPGEGRVAASRAVHVGDSDGAAEAAVAEAVDLLVRRQRATRPGVAGRPYPVTFAQACAEAQFVAGGPQTVADVFAALKEAVPFTDLHLQMRWQGIAAEGVQGSIRRFWEVVRLLQQPAAPDAPTPPSAAP
ncbi:MAG: LLM class flavin-dependent oxidoreductase [Chloroflexota bacterium]|nr:LLM class flavin-dependent oxidoreductase [Chloroflexota bacterium]